MIKIFASIVLVTTCVISFGQSSEYTQTKSWVDDQNIPLNSPVGPEGFNHFMDCDSNHAFRKSIGDSLVLYSWDGAVSEKLATFKESVKSKNFNITRYPSRIQQDGSIVMMELERQFFLWRNDTLYLWNDFNSAKSAEYMNILKSYSAGEISKSEYKEKIQGLSSKDYGHSPKFRPIYFQGVFEGSGSYSFSNDLDSIEKTITLINKWEEQGKKKLAFKLKSHKIFYFLLVEDAESFDVQNCKYKRVEKP